MDRKTIALVGNPNCGKTTLFNGLTGGRIKTGNWPGVTVEKREGIARYEEEEVTVVDLPGIYSFSVQSEDEKIARDYALSGEPSMILNIVDATNLERNLYLTTQLIEMKVPVLVVLNMMDIAEKQGITINTDKLSKTLDLPVVDISAVNSGDIGRVKKEIFKNLKKPAISDKEVEYPNEIESVIARWREDISSAARKLTLDSRWLSVKLLENDSWVKERILENGNLDEKELTDRQNEVEKVLGDSPDIICADYRYGFIHGISQALVKKTTSRRSFTDKLDRIVLNRVLGIPIFLAVIYLVFWATIAVGGAFIDFFDILFGTIFVDGFGVLLENMGAPGWLIAFLAGGIGGGLQMVATFVPILFMMFFMLAILDDSGYMARAAFVMDRFMRLLGLPGKAFVPLLVGFGCTVPAIMATRTLETKKERYLTIFMAPFMSCGARLPVYALFAAAFFAGKGGLVVFSLYIIGILLAVLSGFLMKKTLFRGEASSFIMELPPYHLPRFRHIMIHTWDRLKGFIWRAGKVIVLVVVVLSILNSIGKDGSVGNEDSEESILSVVGKAITPVFKPMGIEEKNWPATVGIFTGLFAKEAVVGTLNSLYGQMLPETEAEEEGEFDFWGGIKEAFVSIPEGLAGIFGAFSDPLGTAVVQEEDTEVLAEEIGAGESLFGSLNSFFSGGPVQAYAYLLFILIYFPCIAAFGAIVKETGMFFGILNGLYLTILAWITATLFYQIAAAHNPVWIIVPLAMIGLLILSFILLGKRKKFS